MILLSGIRPLQGAEDVKACTGMRCCEVADCDAAWLRPGPALRIVGKGGHARVVPVPADVAAWLAATGRAWPATPNTVSKGVRRMLGLPAHTLRRRYATRLAHGGLSDLGEVRRMLGHANLNTTQRYIAPRVDGLRDRVAIAWAAQESQ